MCKCVNVEGCAGCEIEFELVAGGRLVKVQVTGGSGKIRSVQLYDKNLFFKAIRKLLKLSYVTT